MEWVQDQEVRISGHEGVRLPVHSHFQELVVTGIAASLERAADPYTATHCRRGLKCV